MDSLYTQTNIEKLEIKYKILIAKLLLDSWYSVLPTLAPGQANIYQDLLCYQPNTPSDVYCTIIPFVLILCKSS